MYPEFIAIYAGLALLAVMMTVVIILLADIKRDMRDRQRPSHRAPKQESGAGRQNRGVVFCKKCANPFPADNDVCPHCGARK